MLSKKYNALLNIVVDEVFIQACTNIKNMELMMKELKLNLENLDITSVESFVVENAKGLPEYAASTGTICCVQTACSCGGGFAETGKDSTLAPVPIDECGQT